MSSWIDRTGIRRKKALNWLCKDESSRIRIEKIDSVTLVTVRMECRQEHKK